ncbi:MAG: PhoH family protein [Acidobacteriia bacterium]|nr:PhoH family protein [Terriglobia bacterium]
MRRTVQIAGGLESLFGTLDENVKLLESSLHVTTHLQDDHLAVEGEASQVERAVRILNEYNQLVREGRRMSHGDVKAMIRVATQDHKTTLKQVLEPGAPSRPRIFGKKSVTPKSPNQRAYMEAVEKHDMTFAVGPGGTGKTYLAVAMAVSALLTKQVDRIILARPAVEAGERLGFLPGTLQQKIDPYMRPLYDALYDMLDADKLERFLEKGIVEVAPLAFMRGRTLNDSFVILDEAQNTTSEQMKMFLTRLGFNSKAVVTGDVTQIDLPAGRRSGLVEALEVVERIEGISFIRFDERDVVRHNLVQQIIKAYEEFGAGEARKTAGAEGKRTGPAAGK